MSRDMKKAVILKLLAKNDEITLDMFILEFNVSEKLVLECRVIDQVQKACAKYN